MLIGKIPLFDLGAFMLSGMNHYIINPGASGLSRPVNTLMWGVMALLVLLIGQKVSADKYRFTPMALPFVIIGIAVLAISLSYTDPAVVSSTGCCMAVLVTGGGYFAWLQLRLSRAQRQGLLLPAVSGQGGLACCRDERAFNTGRLAAGEQTALCIVLLPIALHTQLEYPFYLSALHLMVFLLVLASVATVGLMLFALLGELALTRAERAGLMDMHEMQTIPATGAP